MGDGGANPNAAPNAAADAACSSMQRDIFSAYVASAAKILSWVLVAGIVYRTMGAEYFALLALIRGTLGILNYTSFGLGPALIYVLAHLPEQWRHPIARQSGSVLNYSVSGDGNAAGFARPIQRVYANGLFVWFCSAVIAMGVVLGYGKFFFLIAPHVPEAFRSQAWVIHDFVIVFGIGLVLRLASDVCGAVLQVRWQIALDNYAVAVAEMLWPGILLMILAGKLYPSERFFAVGVAYGLAGILLLVARMSFAADAMPSIRRAPGLIDLPIVRSLLGYGLIVTVAQLADYLYAPMDYILISNLLSASDVATYAPAVQVDAGLLMLVTALAGVLLPRSAVAHGSGDVETVRRYYLWGTAGSVTALVLAAITVWWIAPAIFRLWLGNPMKSTQAILPLVLVHTVVGGSSAVGRSILLGMGKVKPFTAAVLVAGVCNVVLSFVFVYCLGMGLKGIVWGTVVVVIGRCAIWMPWYVNRALKQARGKITVEESAPVTPAV